MKSTADSMKNMNYSWFRRRYMIVIYFALLILFSCEKYDGNRSSQKSFEVQDKFHNPGLPTTGIQEEMASVYYGHSIFKRGNGAPVVEKQIISNPEFKCYDGNFVLRIQNGNDKNTRVSSAEVKIDGVLIAGPSDFSKNVTFITKPLSGISPDAILEVKINSTPGSFIDLWIEGTKITVTPAFEQIAPLCQNSVAQVLPSNSSNTPAISGIWEPATINTAIVGKAIYTFTPAEGQCAVPVKMEIEITASLIPVFTQIGPLLQNSVPPALPASSDNGITGTWSPATINTSAAGSFTFAFTPAAGLCAGVTTMKIEVTNSGTVSDIDGNIYKTIKIGDQWWMAENLKTTKYNSGDLIGTTTPATLNITGENTPKYQWPYDGIENNASVYGRLYTWYSVVDSRGVCPTGWHVPTYEEFTAMTDFLINNGYGYGGSGPDIAKSLASKTGWAADATPGNVGNDQDSNNSSGYNVFPGGVRLSNGVFSAFGEYTGCWSSTETDATSAIGRALLFNISYVTGGSGNKKNGAYIRCIKN